MRSPRALALASLIVCSGMPALGQDAPAPRSIEQLDPDCMSVIRPTCGIPPGADVSADAAAIEQERAAAMRDRKAVAATVDQIAQALADLRKHHPALDAQVRAAESEVADARPAKMDETATLLMSMDATHARAENVPLIGALSGKVREDNQLKAWRILGAGSPPEVCLAQLAAGDLSKLTAPSDASLVGRLRKLERDAAKRSK